jgi:hypothetical protein
MSARPGLAGALLFAFAIAGPTVAGCTSSNGPSPLACPGALSAADGSACSVAGLACCYGSTNCSCEHDVFSCTDNAGCPAQPPVNDQPCTTASTCIYPTADCSCNGLAWQCASAPTGVPRSCLSSPPAASSDSGTSTVPCGQADPNTTVPFLCRNGVDAAGCCPEGEIYSYLASACVGTWCPAGLACENFTCSDGGAPPVPEGGAEGDAADASVDVASDATPADSTVADGADTGALTPDSQSADSPEDVTTGDASTDSMAADAASGTDSSTGADAGANDAALADVNLPRAP